ncbi:hypothetical protein FSP39_007467 [Pinctada imbricata]|uniref:Peptidase A2 domain-containing protein n=1 Tax=Pinctada imbricata TaxID=66713 RepID=A0AA89BQQ1_PINIB|nr:hypothetical protein FSP39_007467 [Pinctada imbricata]
MTTPKTVGEEETTLLLDAINKGDMIRVRKLLEEGISPNSKDIYGQTALKVAIKSGHQDVVQELIDKGADISCRDSNGQCNFQHLMQDGVLSHEYIISVLDSVNDIQERDHLTGESYLHLLRNRENDGVHTVSLLLRLLKMGISVNNQDFEGDTPLHNMASVANGQAIQALLDHGADASILNFSGQTPIHTVAECSNYDAYPEALQILLEAGIKINVRDKYGQTALHLAAGSRESNAKSVTELLRHKIECNVQDKLGRNEIHHAIDKYDFSYDDNEKKDLEGIVRVLVTHGVDINHRDIFSMTPIHVAAGKHRYFPLNLLVSLNADITLKTRTGATALHLATRRLFVYISFIKLCKNKQMDLSIADSFGSTPLHWAVWFREQIAIKMLLQYGADPSIRDKDGLTAGDLATILKYEDYKLLLSKYENLDEISEIVDTEDDHFDFHGSDIFEECPHLSYIVKNGQSLDLESWADHFTFHEKSVATFIETVSASSYMGFFYDIDENKLIAGVVDHFVQALCTRVSQNNANFQCKVHMTGSMKEETKGNIPHEFDYVFNLTRFSDFTEASFAEDVPDGFVRLRETKYKMKNHEDLKEYISEGFLNGRKLKQKFSLIVNEAVIDILQCDDNDEFTCLSILQLCDEKQNGISNLNFLYHGQKVKETIISVDLALAVSPDNLASYFLDIPNLPLVQSLVQKPELTVVLKSPDGNFIANADSMFRVSLAFLEHEIIRSVPLSIRKGYIIVKAVNDSPYMPAVIEPDSGTNGEKVITTYMIKNCFLHELDKALHGNEISLPFDLDHDAKYDIEVTKAWGRRIITRLEDSFHNRRLPSYFHPEKNLMAVEGTELVFSEPIYEGTVSILKKLMQTIYLIDD